THKPSIIEKKAAEICQAFKQYYLPEQEHKISGSVGAVIIEPGTITNFQQLYEHADTAMYQAKKSGKDQYKITKC
ncbi:MAG: diguanylate cyclase domain-containing protein, partial [Culicoidibacterales bacterium]